MKVWLQSANLTSRDSTLDMEGAVRAFQSHDWRMEEGLRRERELQGLDSCEAGIGLVRPDGQILHICPSGESAVVHHHRKVRLFGFLWLVPKVRTQVDCPMAKVPELIRWFFEGNEVAL